jgi:hypothetical protein
LESEPTSDSPKADPRLPIPAFFLRRKDK